MNLRARNRSWRVVVLVGLALPLVVGAGTLLASGSPAVHPGGAPQEFSEPFVDVTPAPELPSPAPGSGVAPEKDQSRLPKPPPYGSPEEREAAERGAARDYYKNQKQYREEFIKSGQDIHSLPIARFSIHDNGSDTVIDTLRWSPGGGLRGTVVSQTLEDGYVLSVVKVGEWLWIGPGNETVLVSQPGGPQETQNGPVFVQSSQDPVLLPGREYVLFLRECGTDEEKAAGAYCVFGSGQRYLIESGRLVANIRHWDGGLEGATLDEARALVFQAAADLTASP